MARKKLIRFAELKKFPNALEFPENMKGNWSEYFKNKNPIVLELGCGKGEYALQLATLYPKKNFIGIDVQGERLWYGAKNALDKNLANVAWLRAQIENLSDYFDENEISEIWITFPDPRPKKGQAKKRLTSPDFLDRYRKVLKKNAPLHLKTDSDLLYEYTKDVLKNTDAKTDLAIDDIYSVENIDHLLLIQTTFEKKFRSRNMPIHYIRWHIS
jgi:tRNA (guanine-N7-)-methyltransferase